MSHTPSQTKPSGRTLSLPSSPTHASRQGWVRRHKGLAFLMVGLVASAGFATAALLIRQDVVAAQTAVAPDVVFQSGSGYAAINAAGFATLTVGSSGSSATLALSGVPGAAQVYMTNVMKLTNQDATQAYTVTLARSAAPNAALADFTVVVKSGGTTLATWNAVSSATSSSFTLPVSSSLDISIQSVIADGTAAGSLGSFGMQFSLAPV